MYSIHSIRQPLPVASWASFSSNYFFTSSESSTAIFPMRIYRKRLGTRLFFPTSPYRNPVSDATSHLRPLHKLQDSYLRLEKETNTKDCQKPTCWTPATASGLVAESIDLGQKDKAEKNVRNLRRCERKRRGFFDQNMVHVKHERWGSMKSKVHLFQQISRTSTSDVWKASIETYSSWPPLLFFFFFLTFRNDFYLYCEPATGTDLSLINVDAKKSHRLTSEG